MESRFPMTSTTIPVATDEVNRTVDDYSSTSAMRIRLLIRPLDS